MSSSDSCKCGSDSSYLVLSVSSWKSRKGAHKYKNPKGAPSPSSSSESEVGESVSGIESVVPSQSSQVSRQHERDPQLSNITGQESWKVWFTRFEDMAQCRGWDGEKCLDRMLPKWQGVAGEFMLDKLTKRKHSNYNEPVKCLKCGFQKVESSKTYTNMFWKRDQNALETEEIYAA